MGGRKPKAPRIIPGQPPMGESPGLIGSVIGGARSALLGTPSGRRRRRSFAEDARTGNLPEIDFTIKRPNTGPFPIRGESGRKPLPKGALRGLATPPPGSEFTDDNRLIKRGSETIYPSKGRRGRVRGRRKERGGPVTGPGFPSDGASIMPIFRPRRPVGRRMPPKPRPPIDDLGPPPEREVPIPKERLPRITRESDPRGGAPFAPDERGMARDRFFERMFDRAEEAKQKKSMQKEERREVRQARNEERRARRSQPGEINVGNERREIRRSMMEERARRRMEPSEIDVGGEIDINAERGGRRRRRDGMRRNRRGRRRDFTRRRSRMEGGRSMEERAAFRDRYVSTLGGGFFS